MNTTLAGRRGEALAAAYLRKKGYCILAAGYRSPYGEIDLIARRRGVTAALPRPWSMWTPANSSASA